MKLLKELQKVREDFINNGNRLSRASVREFYKVICCSTEPIDPPEPVLDYDMIHTLTFAPEQVGVGTFSATMMLSGSHTNGNIFWRNGTAGVWTPLMVTEPIFDDILRVYVPMQVPITSETMQLGHAINIIDGDIKYVALNSSDKILTINIQNNPLPDNLGNYFLSRYASSCSSLVAINVPNTSNVTVVGNSFMSTYTNNCDSLTTLNCPDVSNVSVIGNDFMRNYASVSDSLISLDTPNTVSLTSIPNNFMASYAQSCISLVSLDVPNTSNVITIGNDFMSRYASGCSSLTSLTSPDTAKVTYIGQNFLETYAYGCTSLTTLSVPDISKVEFLGDIPFLRYATACTSLITLGIPDTSSILVMSDYFMENYAEDNTSLQELILPNVGLFEFNNVNLYVPSSRLGILKGKVKNPADLVAWQNLTITGKTLHTNYIRSSANVTLL